jgi:adenylate kinase family enzyme
MRVLVLGACGAGKTTLARQLAHRLGVAHVELDALHHGPAWTPRPEFAGEVDAATRAPAWVVDGNYRAVRDLLWSRAEALVWLDLPLAVIEARVVRRSLLRWLRGEVLWNGNRERGPRAWIDREHPVRWAWSHHGTYRREYPPRLREPRFAHLRVVRLRSREMVAAFGAAPELWLASPRDR